MSQPEATTDEMTELNDDGGPGYPERSGRRGKGYVRASDKAQRQIAPLLRIHATEAQIVEATGLPISTVRRAIVKIDAHRIARIRKMPDAERGRIHRLMDVVIEKSLRDQPVFDRNGQLVMEPALDAKGNPVLEDGKPLKRPVRVEPNSASLRTVIQAAESQVKLVVGQAPTQSLNVNLGARVEDAERERRLMANPRYRALILEMEEIERGDRPAIQRVIDVTGEVRPGHAEGRGQALGDPATHPPDERSGDEARPRRDRTPDDHGAAADGEVDVLVADLPGVVPGVVPGEADHPGELQFELCGRVGGEGA